MTFAKNAAELLSDPEAEQAPEDKGRWRKYLATGAGLAGLAGAGYYAYKNRGQIGNAIDKFVGTKPAQGVVERTTGMNGGTAGLLGGLGTSLGLRGVSSQADSVVGLSRASDSAKPASPVGRQMAKLKEMLAEQPKEVNGKDMPKAESSNIASVFAPAMVAGETPDPLVQAQNIGAAAKGRPAIQKFTNPDDRAPFDPRRLLDRYVTSRRELGNLQGGLNHLATKQDNPVLTEAIARRVGPQLGNPARLSQELNRTRLMSGSTMHPAVRTGVHGISGAILGNALDKATEQQVP